MKTIGLLGGMSWESTAVYYQHLNRLVRDRLGGLHSSKIVLYSFDFDEIVKLQKSGEWDRACDILTNASLALEALGADMIIICTNTMHKLAPEIQAHIHIPIIHIADVVAEAIQRQNIITVGLLGTKYTMEQDFYQDRLSQHQLNVLIPEQADRDVVNRIIFEELCQGKICDESRRAYQRVIQNLIDQGAEGIILGCTEITLLIQQKDCSVPVFDSTYLHARKAIELALLEELH